MRLRPAVAALLLSASPAAACPLCASPTGERVRSSILGDDFAANLLATLAPFAVLLAVAAAIRFAPFRFRR